MLSGHRSQSITSPKTMRHLRSPGQIVVDASFGQTRQRERARCAQQTSDAPATRPATTPPHVGGGVERVRLRPVRPPPPRPTVHCSVRQGRILMGPFVRYVVWGRANYVGAIKIALIKTVTDRSHSSFRCCFDFQYG